MEKQDKICCGCCTAVLIVVVTLVITAFVFLVLPSETQLYEYSKADCACPQQRSGGIPKRCCMSYYCQAHLPTDERTEKQEKLCGKCRRAGLIVLVHLLQEALLDMSTYTW